MRTTTHFLLMSLLLLGSGCDRVIAKVQGVNLGIPDRAWAKDRPDLTVGWCGEASIQMALGFYGREVSQLDINKAGKPAHADLYAQDIDPALEALGVPYTAYANKGGDVHGFVRWIRNELDQGRPVFCGLKIYPDQHPNWTLDHFVLVVGHKPGALLVNTQLDASGQIWIQDSQLTSFDDGYSFENVHHLYFGRSIHGK
jgi:hypothetical protein